MMTGEIAKDFDGFVTPEGEAISIKDTNRMFSLLVNSTEQRDQITQYLWGLAEDCLGRGYHGAACGYLEKILSLVDAPGEKAAYLLRMGLVMEQSRDYQAALDTYLRAIELPQESNDVWYFLNNNTGFCLNQTGRHQEAERYFRAAIEIQPDRHNAYKNLGACTAASWPSIPLGSWPLIPG
jgi:tetratricopeptide (TPR) repeat protein